MKLAMLGSLWMVAVVTAVPSQVIVNARVMPLGTMAFNLWDLGKPDAMIKNSYESAYIGNNIYNDDGLSQTKEQPVQPGEIAIYHLRIQNDADYQRMPDNITVKGPAPDTTWEIHYFNSIVGGSDITSQIIGTGWDTGALEMGDYEQIRLEVTPPSDVPEGSEFEITITARSNNDANRVDVVKAVTIMAQETGIEESKGNYSFDVFSCTDASIRINYGLSVESEIELSVYDAAGRVVAVLASGRISQGNYSTSLGGRSEQGYELPSGVYFVRFAGRAEDGSSSFTVTKKVLKVR